MGQCAVVGDLAADLRRLGIWRGSLDGKYPYYFLNLPKLGPVGLLREMSIVAAGFLVFGFILLGIARLYRPSSSSK